jgi:methyl-accepting chemotaxis protein
MAEPMDGATAADAIRAIASEGGTLGIEIVDVASHVDDVTARVTAQVGKLHGLRDSSQEVLRVDRAMSASAEATRTVAREVGKEVGLRRTTVDAALADIRSLADVVQGVAARLQELRASLDGAGHTTAELNDIAQQTNILAINASVEAARAGNAGRGFAVIAQAVRDLAAQARDASVRVDGSIKGLAKLASDLAEASQRGKQTADAVGEGTRTISSFVDVIDRAARDIDRNAEGITAGAGEVERRMGSFLAEVAALDRGVEESSESLRIANERVGGLMGLAERILTLSARTGVDTVDRPFLDLAVQLAEAASGVFAEELAHGRVTVPDLFDTRYVPVPGSNPPQVTTRFTALTDRILPALLEPPLERDARIVFVVAVDRNGYLPTHNRKFSRPQGRDPEWNKANSRNRRMFDDRVGLAAARSTDRALIQCYRRDMGGGRFVLMKDASAPIRVDGRHWGAIRIGYR